MKTSVLYAITAVFALALISISTAFFWLMDYDKQNYTRELNTKYSIISRANLYKMNSLIGEDEFQRQTENFKMREIKNKYEKNKIIQNGTVLDKIEAEIGSSAIIFYKNHNYIKITHKDNVLLLFDKDYEPYRYAIFKAIYAFIILIILITYIIIIRKIKPLRKLKREIDKFANGSLDIKNVAKGNDEISDVATAFYDAVMQIRKLNESRQLFLRNIMHELKTPITKGRITVEMIEEGKNRNRLISVFERLENLINEFAAVERATSGLTLNNITTCTMDDIVQEALDIAMLEKNAVEISNDENINVNVDFKLFSIAVKNMIDNGHKYSSNKKVKIIVNSKKCEFITTGEQLEKDLSLFTEPFSKGTNAKQSFGLGLYIVDNILKAHDLALGYRYENQNNIFIFENFSQVVNKN